MAARTPEAEPLLTPAEVATMFRVDPKTVTRWAKAGKLTSVRTLGGHRRYRETECAPCSPAYRSSVPSDGCRTRVPMSCARGGSYMPGALHAAAVIHSAGGVGPGGQSATSGHRAGRRKGAAPCGRALPGAHPS